MSKTPDVHPSPKKTIEEIAHILGNCPCAADDYECPWVNYLSGLSQPALGDKQQELMTSLLATSSLEARRSELNFVLTKAMNIWLEADRPYEMNVEQLLHPVKSRLKKLETELRETPDVPNTFGWPPQDTRPNKKVDAHYDLETYRKLAPKVKKIFEEEGRFNE